MASRKILCNKIRSFMEQLNLWNDTLEAELPHKWENHGDCIVFSATSFQQQVWSDPHLIGDNLYKLICDTMKINKIARKGGGIIHGDLFRRPQVQLLYGPDGWTSKTENKITYYWDVTKVMFSSGNISEKQRIASWNLSEQVVVDLYAGIGYFTLNYLVHSKAKLLYACEWNPDAIESLRINLRKNKVDDRCVILEGDNTIVCPQNVADHVNLGLIPTSEPSWEVACAALKRSTGGILHIHGNVDVKCKGAKEGNHDILSSDQYENMKLERFQSTLTEHPWLIWSVEAREKIRKFIQSFYKDEDWTVEILEIVKVKNYGPCVDHLVVDIKCQPTKLVTSH